MQGAVEDINIKGRDYQVQDVKEKNQALLRPKRIKHNEILFLQTDAYGRAIEVYLLGYGEFFFLGVR